MARKRISRRTFVGSAATVSAFTIVPRHVLGRGFRAPSDTLAIACIGCGGKGRSDIDGVAAETIYALCDVDDHSAADAYEAHPQAKRYKDWRELLDKVGARIDAVTISTPDHSHAAAAMAAMKLKKHVFCQKPLARTLHEVRALAQAARLYKVATQMGNQGHANDGTRQIREWVEAGAIGAVREVHFWTNRPIWPQAIERPLQEFYTPSWFDWNLWLGPALERPYHPSYAPFNWRGWWDFGTGALGDMACHIMDAAYWALGFKYPARVVPESTQLFTETAPKASRIEFEFPARGGRGPITAVWSDGGINPPRPPDWPAEKSWPPDNSGQLWVGDKGTLVAGTYGEDPQLSDPAKHVALTASPPAVKYPRTQGLYAEWIAACKGGPPAGSNFADHAAPLTEMVLLGNLAVRTGKTLELNPETGQITNTTVPEEFITPTYRAGWSL
ncbi:MAG: Gfo/Idh/MocA family oxidoreductase [Gemmatimonadetes bacterium]|nr:Gfo/Idh/MocA family oxidoreductase [Gemmatimonadota bacterium]